MKSVIFKTNMLLKMLLLMSVLFIFNLLITEQLVAQPPEDGSKEGAVWVKTFEDNFDTPQLNGEKWFPGYRPGRKEYYKKIGHSSRWQKDLNAYYVVEDGILKLRLDRDRPVRAEVTDPCVSSIQTATYRYDQTKKVFSDEIKFAQKYGYFEICSRMPSGSGLHAAFWLVQVGANNQEYTVDGKRKKLSDGVVEIDIFEQLGNEVDKRINQFNVHFTKNGHYKYRMNFDPSQEFHRWGLLWEEGRLTWYLDGKKIHVYEGATPKEKMLILLGMYQMGTKIGGFTGPVDPKMSYPRDFEIDWIRVWQRKM